MSTSYIPYTYRIFHRPTKQYYYGCKTVNRKYDIANPKTFWKEGGYFTSSKLVHQLIENYGTHTFEIQKIKKFKISQEAKKWEEKRKLFWKTEKGKILKEKLIERNKRV